MANFEYICIFEADCIGPVGIRTRGGFMLPQKIKFQTTKGRSINLTALLLINLLKDRVAHALFWFTGFLALCQTVELDVCLFFVGNFRIVYSIEELRHFVKFQRLLEFLKHEEAVAILVCQIEENLVVA